LKGLDNLISSFGITGMTVMETIQIVLPIDMQFEFHETAEVIKKSSKTFHLPNRYLLFEKRIAVHACMPSAVKQMIW
jgi:hypothetical protein